MVPPKILNFDKEKGETIINLLDVDDFGLLNLNFGYERGDVILKNIKQYINELPNIIECFGLGSDEFIFSCCGNFDTNSKDIFNLLRHILEKLNVTVSIGITTIENNNFSKERLMDQLRYNLIVAKENGKNKICFK